MATSRRLQHVKRLAGKLAKDLRKATSAAKAVLNLQVSQGYELLLLQLHEQIANLASTTSNQMSARESTDGMMEYPRGRHGRVPWAPHGSPHRRRSAGNAAAHRTLRGRPRKQTPKRARHRAGPLGRDPRGPTSPRLGSAAGRRWIAQHATKAHRTDPCPRMRPQRLRIRRRAGAPAGHVPDLRRRRAHPSCADRAFSLHRK